jgi:PAS domain S-box-containing protein
MKKGMREKRDTAPKNKKYDISSNKKIHPVFKYIIIAVVSSVSIFVLYELSQYNYLLFHSIAEFFSIVIAFSIFMIVWNSRRILDNYFFLFIGIAFLFIGILDFIHTLAYKGMGVFPGVETNLATQLWIAARYIQSFSFLLAFVFIKRKFRPSIVISVYFLLTSFILASIFYWQNFPEAFTQGVGLTSFKILSEYLISLVLLLSIGLLLRNKKEFSKNVMNFLIVSLSLTIVSEMSFTLYTDPYGITNMLGHILKVVAFYFIYKALIEIGLVKPDELLFRNLKLSQKKLETSNTLLIKEIEVRKKIEMSLKNQEERFHSTLDNMLEGCQIIDFDWHYLYVNDAAAKHGATTKDALIGQKMTDVYPEIEKSNMFTHLKECMKTRKSYQMENEFTYTNGKTAWFELSIQPVPEGLFILSQDITERKNTQKKIQDLNEKLTAINEELKSFSYSVSHDLRAPLRSINGYSNMLLEDYMEKLDDQGKNYLTHMMNATTHMNQLIDNLLRLSRIGRTELHLEQVNLSLLAIEINNKIRKENPGRRVRVTIQKNLVVTCDKQLIEILLYNLFNNAWKFTQKKLDAHIKFGIKKIEGNQVFYLSDDGVGFNMKYVDKLFVPFQRLHSNDEFQGIGIGLAIVSRIVHRHDGKIWAESDVEKGATFYFTL